MRVLKQLKYITNSKMFEFKKIYLLRIYNETKNLTKLYEK
jgi:hypothetical protein